MSLIIQLAKQTGGKCTKGYNKTSTIQVFNTEISCIEKQFVFKMHDMDSKKKALSKARKFVEEFKIKEP